MFVVALKNWKLPLPLHSDQLYELSDKEYAMRCRSKVAHTDRLRYFLKLASHAFTYMSVNYSPVFYVRKWSIYLHV